MKASDLTEPPEAAKTYPPTRPRRVGDLAIGFSAGSPAAYRHGSATWTNASVGPEWQLWQQSPVSCWKGFPLMEIKAPGWHVCLLGESYGPHGAALDQTVLEIVRGERPASQLNGHFLLWAWDEAQRQWHAWTNRFGTIHAYYARSGDRAALGTGFDAVAQLASRRQLDWIALTGFFGFGFFPEDRTFYDDVRILRPATHHVFSAKGEEISARRYWDWHHEPDYKRSYDDTVAEFADRFQTVMTELLSPGSVSEPSTLNAQPLSRIALPISGGLDSRSTVAAVNRAGLSTLNPQPSTGFWSYSYGYSDDSVETRISGQVAAASGLPFTPFTIKPYLFDQLDPILGAVEGFQDITQCRQAFIADELRQHADYVIAAHWGDVWLDGMGLVQGGKEKAENRKQKTEAEGEAVVTHTIGKMAKRGRAWLLDNLCSGRVGAEQPQAMLHQFVANGMAPLQHIEDPDFRVKAFKTDNWSFRWTLSSIRMFQAAAFPRLPFYDTRLADFFCTVPSENVTGRRLQVDYLKRFAPNLARIEWQAHGADLFHYQDSDPLRLPKRAVKKALRLVAGKKVIERNWEVQFGGPAGRENLEQWLTRPGLTLHEFVAPEKVQSLVSDFYNRWPDPELGYSVSMLLTFSTWLEHQAA